MLTTIHQPSTRLFYMFDKLILLSQGDSIYFGNASGSMDYFSSIGLNPLIAMNPADFILDLASGNTNDMSIPPALEQETKMSENGARPSPIAVHEVCYLLPAPLFSLYIPTNCNPIIFGRHLIQCRSLVASCHAREELGFI